MIARRSLPESVQRSSSRPCSLAVVLSLLVAGTCLPKSYGQREVFANYPEPKADPQAFGIAQLPRGLATQFELRARPTGESSYDSTEGQNKGYVLTRVYGAIDAKPNDYLHLFAQFIDTHALGLPVPLIASNMRDVFDLRQGYVAVSAHALVPLEVTAGRFELKLGNERVIGISDWTNNSRSWDGFKAVLGTKDNAVTLFSTSVVKVNPSSLDRHGAGLTFHGAYAEFRSLVPNVDLEPFVLVHATRGVTGQDGVTGDRLESTFGSEVEGRLPHGFTYDLVGDLQRGSYANESIHAGAGIAHLNYSLNDRVPGKLRLSGEFHYATGGQQSGRHLTYDQQYPSNHNHFGLVDLFGFQNIRQERMDLEFTPHKATSLLLQGGFLHLASRADGIYASGGSVLFSAPNGTFTRGSLGQEFDISSKTAIGKYWLLQAGLGHLSNSDALRETGHASSKTLGYVSLTYQFSLQHEAPAQAAH